MKAEYMDVWYENGKETLVHSKTVELPFKRISARALIIRRTDRRILGTLHRENGKFALPGGTLEDGESSSEAVTRELEEENFNLIKANWAPIVAVDYFDGYKELSIWHLITVDDVEIGTSEENIESKWLDQDDDVWYPYMQENLILAINRYLPEFSTSKVVVQERGEFDV